MPGPLHTTIHAINSCVIKLSKLTQAVKVWRGFKGATLPKQFFEPNETGVRGGIEYGFSSTTTDREQAVIYAAGSQSTIFEMQMGMVDRGADLEWLSQYPHEQEVLFPFTGLEALATEVDGSTLLVITRLSLNMASLTLEKVLSFPRPQVALGSHPSSSPTPCCPGTPIFVIPNSPSCPVIPLLRHPQPPKLPWDPNSSSSPTSQVPTPHLQPQPTPWRDCLPLPSAPLLPTLSRCSPPATMLMDMAAG